MQGHERTTKQGKQGAFGVSGDMIWALWPGKFPRTSCFEKKIKMGTDGSGWVHMCLHGCSGVYLRAGTGKQGKTRQNPTARTCFAGAASRAHTTSTSTTRSHHEHENNPSTPRSRAQREQITSTRTTRSHHEHERNVRNKQTQAQREHTKSMSTSTT